MPGSGPSQESWSSSRSPEHLGRHGLLLQVHEEGAGLIGTGSSRTPSSTYVGCQNYGEQRKALGHSNCALTRHSAIKPYLIWFVDFASVWLDDWLEMLTKERRGTVKWVVIFLVPSSITDLSHFLLPSVPSSLQIIQELPEGNFASETSLSSAFLLFIRVFTTYQQRTLCSRYLTFFSSVNPILERALPWIPNESSLRLSCCHFDTMSHVLGICLYSV